MKEYKIHFIGSITTTITKMLLNNVSTEAKINVLAHIDNISASSNWMHLEEAIKLFMKYLKENAEISEVN